MKRRWHYIVSQATPVAALGLNRDAGLYDVTVFREGAEPVVLPDTAVRP